MLHNAEEIQVRKFQSPTQVTATYAKDCRNIYIPPMVVLNDYEHFKILNFEIKASNISQNDIFQIGSL